MPALGSGDDRIKASPLARRIAALKGIDLAALKGKGSGPHGRIVKKDVENAKPGVAAPASGGAPASPDGLILPQVLDDRVYAPDTYRLEPLDGMRKTVARRLTQSFMQVPHFPLNVDIALDKLLAARKGINEAAPEGVKVSVNDMLIKASAMALMAEPDCNASFTDNGIAYHNGAHISVAVAIDGGLITPVIRDAEKKGLAEISIEMKDLASRAREAQAQAARIYGRNILYLEPWHVWHQIVRLNHQSTRRHDHVCWRWGEATGCRSKWGADRGNPYGRDADL